MLCASERVNSVPGGDFAVTRRKWSPRMPWALLPTCTCREYIASDRASWRPDSRKARLHFRICWKRDPGRARGGQTGEGRRRVEIKYLVGIDVKHKGSRDREGVAQMITVNHLHRNGGPVQMDSKDLGSQIPPGFVKSPRRLLALGAWQDPRGALPKALTWQKLPPAGAGSSRDCNFF